MQEVFLPISFETAFNYIKKEALDNYRIENGVLSFARWIDEVDNAQLAQTWFERIIESMIFWTPKGVPISSGYQLMHLKSMCRPVGGIVVENSERGERN